jgi:hypothetical protein
VGGGLAHEPEHEPDAQQIEEGAATGRHGSLWEAADTEEAMLQTLLLRGERAVQAGRPQSALREFKLDDALRATSATSSALDDSLSGNEACKVVIDSQAANGELHVKAATLAGLVALLSSNTALHWKLLEARGGICVHAPPF